MKTTAWAALAALCATAWGAAKNHETAKHPDPSWRAIESGSRSFSSWAFASLGGAAEHSGAWARQQRQLWPALLAQPKTTSAAQLALYEKLLCDLANQERAKRGLPILKISPALAEMARAHSREMADKNYFAHESPTQGLRTPMDRYRARFHRLPRLVAENIYMLEGSGMYRLKPQDFRQAHTGWMNSPGHRANILRNAPQGGPTQIGVGIVVRNNAFWATQNFARP